VVHSWSGIVLTAVASYVSARAAHRWQRAADLRAERLSIYGDVLGVLSRWKEHIVRIKTGHKDGNPGAVEALRAASDLAGRINLLSDDRVREHTSRAVAAFLVATIDAARERDTLADLDGEELALIGSMREELTSRRPDTGAPFPPANLLEAHLRNLGYPPPESG